MGALKGLLLPNFRALLAWYRSGMGGLGITSKNKTYSQPLIACVSPNGQRRASLGADKLLEVNYNYCLTKIII